VPKSVDMMKIAPHSHIQRHFFFYKSQVLCLLSSKLWKGLDRIGKLHRTSCL